ncbi:helix-turn-helix transcriptional regulator [Treponema sp. HNW]|uniref:helix-turn-helix transcriptional regulator n=1 Tax=Treponema sp. HNW TaxID=3116654 RepID=UPI003D12D496
MTTSSLLETFKNNLPHKPHCDKNYSESICKNPFNTVEEDDNESYVEITQTDWYKNIVKNRTPQKALRLFRYRDNLTQAALGKKLGIPAQHVSGMENGRRTISPRMARKLADIFGTRYQNFL